MRERAARAVVDAEEASCALRLALRRQAELQGSGRSCPLHPGEDVRYLGEHGGGAAAGAPVFGSVSKALPVVDMEEPTFTVLLQDGKTREVPRSLLVAVRAPQHAAAARAVLRAQRLYTAACERRARIEHQAAAGPVEDPATAAPQQLPAGGGGGGGGGGGP